MLWPCPWQKHLQEGRVHGGPWSKNMVHDCQGLGQEKGVTVGLASRVGKQVQMSAGAPSHFLPFYPSPGPKLSDGNSGIFMGFPPPLNLSGNALTDTTRFPRWLPTLKFSQHNHLLPSVKYKQFIHPQQARLHCTPVCGGKLLIFISTGCDSRAKSVRSFPALMNPAWHSPLIHTLLSSHRGGGGLRSDHLRTYLRIWGGACIY